jgi:hypothetical protein
MSGPATMARGPVVVSYTLYDADRMRDQPGIYLSGLWLRARWRALDGAVGVWLWAQPWAKRCGSVSVWVDEDALRGFVASPEHLRIVRRYAERGRVAATTWTQDWTSAEDVWREARARPLAV